MQTFTFKTVESLEIKADVYLPKESSSKPLPVIIWFHGGGLLLGDRARVAAHFLRGVDKYNFAFVSADYRLAPQAKLPLILEDVRAVCNWVKDDLDDLLGGSKIDSSNISLSGSSAGGYLALLGGHIVPSIRSVLAIYPITDPTGTFFTTPHEPFDHPPLSKAVRVTHDDMKEVLDPQGPVVAGSPMTPNPRSSFYSYMLQTASLATLVFEDVLSEGEKYKVSNLINQDFPPTYVVTTVRDRFVGPEQSEDVVEALKKHHVKHRFDMINDPELDHAFDSLDASVALNEMYEFWKEVTGSKSSL